MCMQLLHCLMLTSIRQSILKKNQGYSLIRYSQRLSKHERGYYMILLILNKRYLYFIILLCLFDFENQNEGAELEGHSPIQG